MERHLTGVADFRTGGADFRRCVPMCAVYHYMFMPMTDQDSIGGQCEGRGDRFGLLGCATLEMGAGPAN